MAVGASSVNTGSEDGLLAAARLVGQGVKAAVEDGFDLEAHGLLILAEVTGIVRHAAVNVRGAHHFDAIASAGRESCLVGALAKFLVLVVSQGNTVHAGSDNESYGL